MSVKTKRALWLGSAVTVAFAGFATIAYADEKADKPLEGVAVTSGTQVAQAETPPPAPEAAPEEKKVERVVVTGSRIKRNEFTSAAPIQVITREETTLEGLNDTSEILQGSTLAAGSQQINNTFGGFVTQGGPGANTLSLRGLGPQRTLILINGRRVAPAGTRGQVGQPDLNTIPESMIERVEILKDGGSSIYGSDAVAGVVNIITRQDYDGINLTAFGNQSFDGGGEEYQATATWGETFERGHFLVSGEYYRREPLRFGDRDHYNCAQDLVVESGLGVGVSGVGTGNLLDIIDPATGQSKCFNLLEEVYDRNAGATGASVAGANFINGGRFVADPTAVAGGGVFGLDLAGFRRVGLSYVQAANRLFGTSATATANAVYAALTPAQRTQLETEWRASTAAVPNADPRYLSTTLIAPATRYSIFTEGAYDLLPGLELYTEMAFNRRESEQDRWRQLFPNVCGGAFNGYGVFPPTGGAAACTGAQAFNPFGQNARSIAMIPTDSEQTVDFYRAVLGARGGLGDKMPIFSDWSYDFYVQHTRSESDYTNDIVYNDRVNATTGAGTCNQALITISGGNCADIPLGINWFRPSTVATGQFSPEEAAFLFTKETGHTTYTQSIVNGVITGDVVELPYGVMSAALGFEVRRDEIDDTPGFNARNNNLWGQTSAGRTAGSDSVAEAFVETSIPLLAGMKFAESLTLDASARYTNYDSYGDGSTYKLGLNYQITPEYRLRGTTGTNFRAPALFELYLANQTGFLAQANIDPCRFWDTSSNPLIVQSCGPTGINLPNGYTGPYSSALILTGGGAGLTAETSESRTVGFIWTPDWIDLSVALDYWEFEVNNEVAQFGALNIVTACHTQFPLASPANPFCNLFTRDLTPGSPTFGMITQVNNSYTNISNQTTDGLDIAARYEHEFSFGKLLLNFDGSWSFTQEVRTFLTVPTTDFNGEVYSPDFVGRARARFDWTDWTFFYAMNMATRASNDEDFGGRIFAWRGTPFAAEYKQYTEFTATHDISARYRADDWSITFGVQNVFDEPPPYVSTTGAFGKTGNAVAIGGPYDLVGRSGFIELSKDF